MVTLRDVLSLLDPSDDSAWTEDGLPRVEVVAALLERGTSRAEIAAAAPDFSRLSPVLPAAPGPDDVADVGEQVVAVLKPATADDQGATAAAAELQAIQDQRREAEAKVAVAEAEAAALREAEAAAAALVPTEDDPRTKQEALMATLRAQHEHDAKRAATSQLDRAMAAQRGYGRSRPRYPRHGG